MDGDIFMKMLEQFKENQKHIKVEGLSHSPLDVAYTDMGEGEAVILLHGIPAWSYLWNEVIPPLAENCRVIAPDLLGYGYSDKRDTFDRSVSVQASMIVKLMDSLGIDKATVVGHDIGGAVAQVMSVNYANRLNGLILANTVAYESWPSTAMISLSEPKRHKQTVKEVIDFVSTDLLVGLGNMERKDKFVPDMITPYNNEEGKKSFIRNASALNTNHTMELVNEFKNVNVPTLVLWGVDDPWQPLEDGERLAQDIPGAKLIRIEGASHWIQYDVPEVVAKHISDFSETVSMKA